MKVVSAIIAGGTALALVSTPPAVRGQDDQYVEIYRQIDEADQLLKGGQPDRARLKYEEAQAALKKLQSGYPAWNTRTVQYRLEYVQSKLGSLPKTADAKAADGQQPGTRPSVVDPASSPEEQVAQLQQQVARLQEENRLFQAKLQEALQAQPAAVDPRELEEAQGRIRQLEKEKDLLKVEVDKAQAKQGDAALLQALQAELDQTKKKLAENVASIAALTQDKQALAAEKAKLQEQLNKPAVPDTQNSDQKKITDSLYEEIARLRQENQELQNRLKAAPAPAPAAPAPATPDQGAVEKLQKERDELLAKLNAAHKELFAAKAASKDPEAENLREELAGLRAKVEALEARKVPYTPEELALFKAPEVKPATEVATTRRAPKELPAGAATLVSEAQRAFAGKRYAEAEQKYLEVLKMDETNPSTLSNLAAIQLEQDKFAEAEANLKKALSIDPEDPYALSLSGILNFRQEKYDVAQDFLSRSAQIDPKNAETQNYLGITLSQKGQRQAAEAALRKAVQLAPGYAGAHHNLAVVYATQKPPFIELAKFHYQKALRGGHPENPDLEKLMNSGGK